MGEVRHRLEWSLAVCLLLWLSACAARDVPSEAAPKPVNPSRTLWLNPPVEWKKVEPAPRVFEARSWLERLVCPNGEQPRWRLTKIQEPFEDYRLKCGEEVFEVELDWSRPPPDAPFGFRLRQEP